MIKIYILYKLDKISDLKNKLNTYNSENAYDIIVFLHQILTSDSFLSDIDLRKHLKIIK
jgi:hypothetical protein